MPRVCAQLIPGKSGSNYTAEFSGNANRQALERATEITIYGGTSGKAVEISDDETPGTWRATGTTIAATGYTHIVDPPVCRALRLAAEAAAATPPCVVLVRHDVG